jgi:hypothetical protein
MANGDHDDPKPGDIILAAGARNLTEKRPPASSLPRSAKTYLACAVLNPYHLILLSGALLLCLFSWSPWALLVELGAEVVLVGALPFCGFFRRRADAHLDRADRAAALRAREALIQRMAEGHRHEALTSALLAGDPGARGIIRQTYRDMIESWIPHRS